MIHKLSQACSVGFNIVQLTGWAEKSMSWFEKTAPHMIAVSYTFAISREAANDLWRQFGTYNPYPSLSHRCGAFENLVACSKEEDESA